MKPKKNQVWLQTGTQVRRQVLNQISYQPWSLIYNQANHFTGIWRQIWDYLLKEIK